MIGERERLVSLLTKQTIDEPTLGSLLEKIQADAATLHEQAEDLNQRMAVLVSRGDEDLPGGHDRADRGGAILARLHPAGLREVAWF